MKRFFTRIYVCWQRVPITSILVAMIWLAFLAGGANRASLHRIFGLSTRGDANFLHLFSSGITSPTLMGALGSSLFIAVLGVVTERSLGWARYLLIVLASQAVTVPVGLGLCHAFLGGSPLWHHELTAGNYLSPSAWIFTASMVASARMPTLWRRRVRLIAFGYVTTALLFTGTIATLVAFTGCVLGFIAGELAFQGGNRLFRFRATISLREQRFLVAFLIACVTFVPLIVSFHAETQDPFLRTSQLLWESTEVRITNYQACQTPDSLRCFEAVKLANQHGVGSAIASLLPGLLQLLFTYGLLRGRRGAWVASLLAQLANLVLVATQFISVDISQARLEFNILSTTFAAIPWLICFFSLLFTRRLFRVRAKRKNARLCLLVILMGLMGACLFWFIGTLAMPNAFTPRATLALALQQLPSQLLPPVLSILLPFYLVPVSAAGWFISSWTVVIMWVALTLAFSFLLFGTDSSVSDANWQRAREILVSGSGDHLSFMTLWEGNSYFFSDDGYVAYRHHGGVAVTLGEPVVASGGDKQRLASTFEAFVLKQGWHCAWYSVSAEFERPEFHKLHVAEESILHATQVGFTGKKFQNIRTARNNAAKEGITALWTTWEELDLEMREKIAALSEEWVAQKALPEMGFTLGTLEELQVPGTKLLLAVDQQENLHGVTSWLPVYQQGQLAGYTLDFMRRDREGFRAVIEFLLAQALVQAVSEGLEWISLSGAPLAKDSTIQNPGLLDAVLNKAGQSIEPLYGFQSLANSKYKFHPEHRGWYLAYNDELALGSIALAVVSCYLPSLRATDTLNTVRLWLEAQREKRLPAKPISQR
ncbi:hypothetical protein HMPREF9278_2040 [Mobiluncus mulieris FB024-16]|uniref:bifunctional lysylphosphatidylglycerol flippase/synthetase MprF n=1 Tax=Mobiluncus mulieris TaxID=2052 RepID=UPI0001E520F0|nr:DUF2156 domain-containing protein [Mobiluncus mulieris]EFN92888.1 hypothetical protein HMPREF9278_2040 [Mobiluncus mulieris FB024-16]